MSESRWRWVRRPRWALPLILIGGGLAWCLWPITLYELADRTRGIGIVLPDSSETQGGSISMSPHYEGPWVTRERVVAGGGTRVADLGDVALWRSGPTPREPDREVLSWSRGNFSFTLAAKRLGEHEPGTEGWTQRCEDHAREIDRQFLDGHVDGHEIRRHRWPRAWIWARSWWDERERQQGGRPEAWWKDW